MSDPPKPDVRKENLNELYKLSLENLRYQHSDIWRGQQFYTTLNVGIITAALALVRFFESGANNMPELFWIGPVILFGVGIITSLSGLYTVKRLREYFLYAVARKTLFEYLLGYRTKLTDDIISGFPDCAGSSLAVPPIYDAIKDDIYDESLSKNSKIISKPGPMG